jgi:hypothetical protein
MPCGKDLLAQAWGCLSWEIPSLLSVPSTKLQPAIDVFCPAQAGPKGINQNFDIKEQIVDIHSTPKIKH